VTNLNSEEKGERREERGERREKGMQ